MLSESYEAVGLARARRSKTSHLYISFTQYALPRRSTSDDEWYYHIVPWPEGNEAPRESLARQADGVGDLDAWKIEVGEVSWQHGA